MHDGFGRQVDYLRVSITDRCNERCGYCMPEHHSDWLPKDQILSFEEIERAVRIAVGLGFRRFRITGGEPLVRTDAVALIEQLGRIDGVASLSMTTNATRLAPVARRLRAAGVTSINISLDALDADRYHRITRGRLDEALAGIDAAIDAGFEKIKLNTVMIRDLNEDQLWPIVEYGAARGLPVRFIELMPVSSPDMLDARHFLSIADAMTLLSKYDTPEPITDRLGHGPARYWRLARTGAVIGFIGAMTDEHFCESCNKMRLTADGFIRPCLGNHGELDLKPALRDDGTDEAIERVFRQALTEKPLEHVFRDQYTPLRIMTAIGG
ncbi:MAG: GTP 3',8-cyclase MoaA [Planctomycetes bacterium]|nr:GTP 3',8-cyclase MoaA [Planctomycetota bacterium]